MHGETSVQTSPWTGHPQQILTNPKWPIGKSQFSLGRCPRTRIAFAFPRFGGADARYMAIEIAHKKAPRPAFDAEWGATYFAVMLRGA